MLTVRRGMDELHVEDFLVVAGDGLRVAGKQSKMTNSRRCHNVSSDCCVGSFHPMRRSRTKLKRAMNGSGRSARGARSDGKARSGSNYAGRITEINRASSQRPGSPWLACPPGIE